MQCLARIDVLPRGSGTRRRRAQIALWATISLLCGACEAAAQDIGQLALTFAPFQADLGKNERPFGDFWSGLALLREEDNRQRTLNGTISIGFNGDQAEANSLFKLKTGAKLTRGAYPAELEFTADLSLQVKGSELQEDVTHLVARYDYHHTKYVEYYAFVERFTDNFMGIQERYETGFGALFGANLIRTDRWANTDRTLARLEASHPVVQATLDGVSNSDLKGRTRPSAADYESLRRMIQSMSNVFLANESHLFLGVAFSVFSEVEQAKIQALATPATGPSTAQATEKTISLSADHRVRWTVRPTAVVRPAESLQILVHPYLKLPLDGPRHTIIDGQRLLDYRVDLLTSTNWNLARSMTGSEQVGFAFKFEHRFDNVPPRIPQEMIQAEERAGTILTRTIAQRHHTAVSLELTVRWGGN